MSSVITKSSKKRTRQVNEKIQFRKEYRDCIKSRKGKIGITGVS